MGKQDTNSSKFNLVEGELTETAFILGKNKAWTMECVVYISRGCVLVLVCIVCACLRVAVYVCVSVCDE